MDALTLNILCCIVLGCMIMRFKGEQGITGNVFGSLLSGFILFGLTKGSLLWLAGGLDWLTGSLDDRSQIIVTCSAFLIVFACLCFGLYRQSHPNCPPFHKAWMPSQWRKP